MHSADLRIFLAVVSAGSLSGAARQLGTGAMQVSRRIAALEGELGVRLFHRSTRAVSLTEEGDALLPYAITMVEADDSARRTLHPAAGSISGTLRVTAPSVFGQTVLVPLLAALLERHPDLRVDLDVSDRVIDLVGSGCDLAIRIAPLADSELVAKKLARNPRMIVAAPGYLKRCGTPARLADLANHACISLQAVPRWPLLVRGALERMALHARITTSNVDTARTAARQGLGLTMLTYWDVHEQLRNGELVAVTLEDAAMEDLSIWAVMPARRFVPARVTVFLEALEAALSPHGTP